MKMTLVIIALFSAFKLSVSAPKVYYQSFVLII